MSIAEAERAAKVRAAERSRAREQASRLGAGAAALAQIVGDEVPASSVQLDENDAGIADELATAQGLKEKITAADSRLAGLRNELAAAKQARTKMVLILVGVAVVGILILSQVFK
jgi:hypothetical protein